jgi:tRNA (guanine26-N2/guanine27-N2)-dimethyltransferase
MNESISYDQVTEGTTTVFVPKQQTKERGPGKKQGLPFYNPAMELNRDISVAVVQCFLSTAEKNHLLLLDGLASTGIRGIRFAHELNGSFEITINDWSEEAFAVIKKNVNTSISNKITSTNRDLNSLLHEKNFDYIDVDPFGSPVSFIDAAMESIQHQGILAVSATDTAALCGVYPKVCKRRYAALPHHGPVMHEVGLRILLGFIAREAAKHDKGIQPILSYKTDHYFRLYVRISRNVSKANETANQIQCIESKEIFPFLDSKSDIGPLWIGGLHSKNFIEKLKKITEEKQFGTKKRMMKLFTIFEEEANAPLFYFTTNDVASLLCCSPPKLERLFSTFIKQGIPIFRTQFDPTGFKTSASFDQVKDLFLSSCKTDR